MALAELGKTMSRAMQQMLTATIIDEKVLNDFMDEISRALLQSDVPLDIVSDIQTNMKKIVNLEGDFDKPRLMQFAIFNELCRLLYHGNPSFTPEKGKASVIMFVGQGTEKTICTKYAYYHLKKGWKPALVCANTTRAGAFDQLEQNAINAKIPFYESCTESDPVRIAIEGVERFKKENCDLIIVDTSGCYKQDASLFEEMRQVAEATKPDLVIFVMDSRIGQAAAYDQARAFKQSVSVGAVILTKMDGHAKGVGALSAVAATETPVIFIGTGVLKDEFTVFDVTRFVSRILGMDNLFRWMDKIHKRKVIDRNITLRTMYERFQKTLKRGSIGKDFGQVIEATIKGYVTIMDFMTDEELDNSNPMLMTKTQMIRIAEAAGQQVEDVMDLLAVYKQLEDTRRKMKELKILKKAEMSALSQNRRKMKELKILKKAALSQNRRKMKEHKILKKAEMSALSQNRGVHV